MGPTPPGRRCAALLLAGLFLFSPGRALAQPPSGGVFPGGPEPAPEVEGVLEIAPIPSDYAIGPRAEALDARGAEFALLPGNLTFQEKAGAEELLLPVSLNPGQAVERFEDPASGLQLVDDEVRLPLKNSDGTVAGILLVDLGNFSASEQGARAPVERVQLVTSEVNEDFGQRDPEVGEVEAQISVDLKAVPQGAQLKVDPELNLTEKEESLFRQAAKTEGLAVKDFAYQVAVEKRGLKPEAATVTLKVDPKWVTAQGGPEWVRIFRDDEQGNVSLLPTFYTGLDAEGHAVFVASSPGLSIFSLAAVEGQAQAPARPLPPPRAPPWGLLGLIAAVGIAVGITLGFRGPPGGGMNPWLRLALKSSGELKEAEQMRERKTATEAGAPP